MQFTQIKQPRALLIAFAISAFGITGCAHSHPQPEQQADATDHRKEIESLMRGDIGKIDDKALETYLKTDTQLERSHGHRASSFKAIPTDIDARVRWWIYYFAIREHDLFQRQLDRGELFHKMVSDQLQHNLMPTELFNLALIESGFAVHAQSDASAAGIWQLIASTGKRYGLHVDQSMDERMHPLLATQAAIRHLLDLRRKFNSWYLVLAAYNAGPQRIERAIRRGKSRDFWVLASKHVLPKETMDYIPKFMASVIICSHAEAFGFKKLDVSKSTYPELVAVSVKPGARLQDLARRGHIDFRTLKHFNPQLKSDHIPQVRNAVVWIPANQADPFRAAIRARVYAKRKGVIVAER